MKIKKDKKRPAGAYLPAGLYTLEVYKITSIIQK